MSHDSNSAVQPFEFDGQPIRIVMINNEPWFVLIDVCKVLGIGNSRAAAERMAGYVTQADVTDALGRERATTVISEIGMYRLAFRSDKENAERFTDWAAGVIKQVRQTGVYVHPEVVGNTALDNIAVIRQQAALLLGTIDKVIEVERKIDQQARAIEAYEVNQHALTDRIGQLEENHDRVTAVGYANIRGIRSDVQYLNRLGRHAARIAAQEGIPVSRVHSTIWGEVNAWPVEVWDEAYGIVGP